MTTPSNTAREIALVRDALRFFVWAAGEGLSPAEDDAPEPETTLFEYAVVTGNEDWDNYPDTVTTALTAAYARGIEDARQWQPIETAPKDGTKILVYFDARSDPYHADDEGKLTPFGAHAEGGDFLDGSGVCVAKWVKSWSEPLDEYSSVRMPGWWFAWFNGDTEYVVAPTHWMPLPQPPAEGGDE